MMLLDMDALYGDVGHGEVDHDVDLHAAMSLH